MEQTQGFWNELRGLLMGDLSAALLVAIYILVSMGVFVSFAINVKNRDKESHNTPKPFSNWFLIKDNCLRLLSAVVIIFLTARFAGEWMSNASLNLMLCPIIGFFWDRFVIWLRERWYTISESIFGATHDKYKVANQVEKVML